MTQSSVRTKKTSPLYLKKMILAALFLALGIVLPFLTGQIPEIGSMLLPMHIPVLLCGFICGGWWGLAVGAVCPLLRSVLFGMPPMFPAAVSMTAELAVYGLVTGLMYHHVMRNGGSFLRIFSSLLTAMIAGRLAWGIVRVLISFASAGSFTWQMFLAGAVTTAIPGIVLQLILIPFLLAALEKAKVLPLEA